MPSLRSVRLLAVGVVLPLAACLGAGDEDAAGPSGNSASAAATQSATGDAEDEGADNGDAAGDPRYGIPLTELEPVPSAGELQTLLDDGLLPPGTSHGIAIETMTDALAGRPRPDVMLFGDSMTQQGVDPIALGDALKESAGRQVTVFNAASSRARWGVNLMVARHAEESGRLPKVAILMISTRAAERDNFYATTVQHTSFSHVVEGCDRETSEDWSESDEEACRLDLDDLTVRYATAGGQVLRAREGLRPPESMDFPARDATLRSDGFIGYRGTSISRVETLAAARVDGRNPGLPHVSDDALEQFTALVDLLEGEGVTVLAAEIPYSPPYQRALTGLSDDHEQRRQRAATALAEAGGIELFPVDGFGDWWGDRSSRDEIHLSAEGASDFADQLVGDTPGFADAVVEGLTRR